MNTEKITETSVYMPPWVYAEAAAIGLIDAMAKLGHTVHTDAGADLTRGRQAFTRDELHALARLRAQFQPDTIGKARRPAKEGVLGMMARLSSS